MQGMRPFVCTGKLGTAGLAFRRLVQSITQGPGKSAGTGDTHQAKGALQARAIRMEAEQSEFHFTPLGVGQGHSSTANPLWLEALLSASRVGQLGPSLHDCIRLPFHRPLHLEEPLVQ